MLTKIIFIFVPALCNPQLLTTGPNTSIDHGMPRVVGGDPCDETDYPFFVAVVGSDGYRENLCGGTLITFRWVLTAGHCIKPGSLTVTSGFNFAKPHYQRRNAKKAVIHEQFDLWKFKQAKIPELRYDIALILLEKPFVKSSTCNVVNLPKSGFSRYCPKGRVLGIGCEDIVHRRAGININKPLKCVELHITTARICAQTFPGSVIDDSIICTRERVMGKDACQGDSGGPLLCKDNIIIGIVSCGRGCGVAGRSASFTQVESYLTFISGVTKINFNKKYVNPDRKPSEGGTRNVRIWLCATSFLLALFYKSF